MKPLIIFDCDGTLIDSESIACDVFPSVWTQMGYEMSRNFFCEHFIGMSNSHESVKKILSALPPKALETSEKIFEEELRKRVSPVKGMLELVKSLQNEKCVASNSSVKYLEEVLAITQFHQFFHSNVYSAKQVSRPKPAPDVFLHAAAVLGYNAKDCVVVEDSKAGVEAAKAAGMKVIGFMAGQHYNKVLTDRLLAAKADVYCSNAEELKSLLNNL